MDDNNGEASVVESLIRTTNPTNVNSNATLSHSDSQTSIMVQSTPTEDSSSLFVAQAAVTSNSNSNLSSRSSKKKKNLTKDNSDDSQSGFRSFAKRVLTINKVTSAQRHQIDSESIGPGGGALRQQPTPLQLYDNLLEDVQKNQKLKKMVDSGCCGGHPGRECFDNVDDKDGIISGGELVFDNNFKSKCPYIHVMPDVKVQNVANVMVDEWRLPIPRIAAFILTNCGELRSWTNQRQINAFKKGLMKAANTTSMWLVTNGLDVGVSKLIGDTVEQELKEIKAFRYYEKHKASFNLIGIANDNNLSYTQQFFGPSIALGKPGPIVSQNCYELNQQHTNFVVLKSSRNSSDQANTALLLNLIDYLTKRNVRLRRKKQRMAERAAAAQAHGQEGGEDDDEDDEDQNPIFTGNQDSNFTTMSTTYYDATMGTGDIAGGSISSQQTTLIRPFAGSQQQGIEINNDDTTDRGSKRIRSVSRSQSRAQSAAPTISPTSAGPTNPLEEDRLSFVSKPGNLYSFPASLDSDTDFNDLTIQAQSCTIDSPLNKFDRGPSGAGGGNDGSKGTGSGSDQTYMKSPSTILSETIVPVICLVIQGGFNCSKLVLENLRRHNPVIVFRGSGGFADLLSYAYLEMQQRCRDLYTSWDAEFVEHTLKPLLTSKIVKRFPLLRNNALGRNSFRDRIIECVRESGSPKGRIYLTILNMHNSSCHLDNLSEYILLSLFKSQNRRDTLDENILRKDLYLTVDWNCSHVALAEVLRRNPTYNLHLEKSIFEVALIRDNREDFVDLFLSNGFRVHKYLTPFRFRRLIRYSLLEKEFFRTVCMENIIGIPVWSVNFEEVLTTLDSSTGDTIGTKNADNFIRNEFNQLIFTTTYLQSFVNVGDLYLNIMGMYPVDEDSAERKSLAILTMWAVFNRRIRLAEILWKHSDQPIHLGLTISMMLERLAWFVSEQNLKDDLQTNSKQFAQFAIGVMDVCFRQDEKRAYDLLSQQNTDWDCKTAVDIAANGSQRAFIAHPCCQKWLTNLFNGRIRIRELSWGFTISPVIKIILSAFLIFPMYIWIRFLDTNLIGLGGGYGTDELKQKTDKQEDEFEVDDLKELEFKKNFSNYEMKQMDRKKKEAKATGQGQDVDKQYRRMVSNVSNSNVYTSGKHRDGEAMRRSMNEWLYRDVYGPGQDRQQTFGATFLRQRPLFIQRQPPIWTMIYLMWNSPITKFWTYQVLYIMYLAILSLAVIYPGCGNWYLDSIACLWTFLSLLEQISRTVLLFNRYTAVPMVFKCVEIVALILFLTTYTFGRVLVHDNHSLGYMVSPYAMKVTLCLGLLYFYYRLFAIHLPISPTLGPLLHRFKLMITVDFIHFMRMALILLISSGIIIQAVLYPNTELSIDMFHKAFHRAAISLFLTPVDELTVKCNKNFDNSSLMRWKEPAYSSDEESLSDPAFMNLSASSRPRLTEFLYNSGLFQTFYSASTCPKAPISMADSCPQTGFWAYFFSFQYFIFLKLILMTLLYALFANTASRLQTETDHIWKFQRYLLVIDFANRPALHAPLSFFAYLYLFPKFLLQISMICCNFICCKRCGRNKQTNHQVDGKVTSQGGGGGDGPTGTTDSNGLLMNQNKRLTVEDYNFWRHLAKNFYQEQEKKRKETDLGSNSLIGKQLETVQVINEEIEHQKHVLRTIKSKMAEMERLMYQTQISLESIRHSTVSGHKPESSVRHHGSRHSTAATTTKPSHSHHSHHRSNHHAHSSPFGSALIPGTDPHLHHHLSRLSPYSGTMIQRFPIADKFISWDIIWINYDPVIYSRKREDFPLSLRCYVDEDILALKGRARFLNRTGFSDDDSPVLHLPVFNWNIVSVNPAGLTIDRRSWLISHRTRPGEMSFTGDEQAKNVEHSNKSLIYKLDDGIPVNPFGRTGLRGKGNLARWGPNHYSLLIVTRSRTMLFGGGGGGGGSGSDSGSTTGSTMLQFALEHRFNNLQIPMRFVGDEKLFTEIRPLFNPKIIGTSSNSSIQNHWNTEDEMFDYFRQCSPPSSSTCSTPTNLPKIVEQLPTSSSSSGTPTPTPSSVSSKYVHIEPVYVQYLDSPENTDNAWKEAKVFHVHFNSKTPNSITDNLFSCGGAAGGGPGSSGSSLLVWLNSSEDLLVRLPMEQVPIMNSIMRRFHHSDLA